MIEFEARRGKITVVNVPLGPQSEYAQNFLQVAIGRNICILTLQQFKTENLVVGASLEERRGKHHEVVMESVIIVTREVEGTYDVYYGQTDADHIHLPNMNGQIRVYTDHSLPPVEQFETGKVPLDIVAALSFFGLKEPDVKTLKQKLVIYPTQQIQEMFSRIVSLEPV